MFAGPPTPGVLTHTLMLHTRKLPKHLGVLKFSQDFKWQSYPSLEICDRIQKYGGGVLLNFSTIIKNSVTNKMNCKTVIIIKHNEVFLQCNLMTSRHSIAGKSFPLAKEEAGKLNKCKHKVNVLYAYIVYLYHQHNSQVLSYKPCNC